METKYYAPRGVIDPLTVTTKPGVFSVQTAALNLLRMKLMDEDETLTAEQSFQALNNIPKQELTDKVRQWAAWLQGRDEALTNMYERTNLAFQEGANLEPVENVPEMLDQLDQYPLNQFLQESLLYESPYV